MDSAGKGKEMYFLGKIFVLHEYSACSLPAGNSCFLLRPALLQACERLCHFPKPGFLVFIPIFSISWCWHQEEQKKGMWSVSCL